MDIKTKMRPLIGTEWTDAGVFPFKELSTVNKEIKSIPGKGKVLPDTKEKIWKAFKECPYDKVRVVVIGMDPYHTVLKNGECVATGLCFQTSTADKMPPSLKRILKEIEDDCYTGEFDPERLEIPDNELWGPRLANQGVLMLNTALTVTQGSPGAHTKAWKPFTRKLIQTLDKEKKSLIWLLMGNHAKSFKDLIKNGEIVESGHPSPLNSKKTFLGSKPFSRVNEKLNNINSTKINW
jgi:uracil-DNA glycosylase